MSVVKKHDIVDDILICQENSDRIASLIRGKLRWEEMEEKDREELIKITQSKFIKEKNVSFKCSYPYMKQTTIDCSEIYSGTLGEVNELENLRTGKKFEFENCNKKNTIVSSIVLPINLNDVIAFKNLKNKWLYFKLNKIEVEFRNNSKASFVPISCYYLPPCSDLVLADIKFTNNVKICSGTNVEHKSILNPFYIIRTIKDIKETIDSKKDDYNDICLKTNPTSGLEDNLFVSNFNDSNNYLDYGRFIFTTNNLENQQDVLMKLHYSFKFYTYSNPEAYYDSANDEEIIDEVNEFD